MVRRSTRPKKRCALPFRRVQICANPDYSPFATSCTRKFRIWMGLFPPSPRRTATFNLRSCKLRRVSMNFTRTKRGGRRSSPNGSSLPTTSVLSYAKLKRRSENSRSDTTIRYGGHHTCSQAFGAHSFSRPLLSMPSVKRSMITNNTSSHEYKPCHKHEKTTIPHDLHGDHDTKLMMMQNRS